MSSRRVAIWSGIVVGLVLGSSLTAVDLLLEAHALADGRTAVILDHRLYLPDPQKRLVRAADGSYALREGGAVTVSGGRATPPAERRLETPPPPVALSSSLASGEPVALIEGELLLVEADGRRRPIPDGIHHFQNGSVAQVRGGRLIRLGDLTGFRQIDPRALRAPAPEERQRATGNPEER